METHDFAEILTFDQVAQFLALPKKFVRRLIQTGQIKRYGSGGNIYFLKSQIERLKNNL